MATERNPFDPIPKAEISIEISDQDKNWQKFHAGES